MGIVVWLVIINIAVFIHELAHYWAAKMQGVRVHAFSVGMGPIVWRKHWNNTEWRISALPIGGYVDIDGMAPQQDEHGNVLAPTHGYAGLGWLGKVWILLAGPLSNVLLAIALFAGVLMFQGKASTVPGPVVLQEVLAGYKAEELGLKVGDTILEIAGKPTQDPLAVRKYLLSDGMHTFLIKRGEKTFTLEFEWSPAPTPEGTRPLLGIKFKPLQERYDRLAFLPAVSGATSTLLGAIPETLGAFVAGVGRVFAFTKPDSNNPNEVMGPVGTVQASGEVAKQGFGAIVLFASIINLSLGVFNLLPIPGLDGGRILVASLVAARRAPLKPGQEEWINFLGFAFVIVFIVLVTFRDIARIVAP